MIKTKLKMEIQRKEAIIKLLIEYSYLLMQEKPLHIDAQLYMQTTYLFARLCICFE
jgi:hypothetical protein